MLNLLLEVIEFGVGMPEHFQDYEHLFLTCCHPDTLDQAIWLGDRAIKLEGAQTMEIEHVS